MEEGHPSRTAIVAAMLRAGHYLLDREPKILTDSFARAFAGFSSNEELLNALNNLAVPDFARDAHIVCRA